MLWLFILSAVRLLFVSGIVLRTPVWVKGLRSTQRDLFLDELDQALLRVVGDDHPETSDEDLELARLRSSEGDEMVMNRVLRLESGGALQL